MPSHLVSQRYYTLPTIRYRHLTIHLLPEIHLDPILKLTLPPSSGAGHQPLIRGASDKLSNQGNEARYLPDLTFPASLFPPLLLISHP